MCTKTVQIALLGKSGVGKTEIANYLACQYDFMICNTGKRCRELAIEFFCSENRDILNKITDCFNAIERGIWLKLALKEKPLFQNNIVIDSIRYLEDYDFIKSNNFKIWLIESSQDIRLSRLKSRGQIHKIENDSHQSEIELQDIFPDIKIDNRFRNLQELYKTIDIYLRKDLIQLS